VTFTDITAQREAEADQRSARQKLDAILRTTPLATIVVDRDGKVRLWNPAAERLFGWKADEVVGRAYPVEGVEGGPAPRAIFEDAYDGLVWNGEEVRRRTRDGKVLDLSLWNATLSGEDGEAVGVVGVFADITERKALEAQFLQSQKMEAVGRLAGGVAHDFNNLLTAITGHTGLLLDEAEEGTEQHADLMEIRRAAERAASLTGQLLAFSRKQVLRPQVLDLNAVVRDTEAMLRRLIGEDIDMDIRCHARIPTVRADRGQVEQVLVNLVVNARDAMPTGGRLTIATDAVVITPENAQAHPYGVQPGAYVRVTVADTGTGMPAEVASRVFEPFFTTKEVGTGLGLSTVYGIVKQSGGYVWVESEPGRGSTFRVYLPRVYDAVETPAAAGEGPLRAGGETILVVEDDHAVRALAVRILAGRGYRVLSAEDGMTALEQVAPGGDPVDLLLTDVVLPGISGPETARAVVRASPRTEVLFMSGYTDQALAVHGVQELGDRLLSKPFSPEQLVRRVRGALDRSRPPTVTRG
jgi:PAS domain S-box-containing protein